MGVRDRQQREREARRQAILAAAAKVFARRGVQNATVEMIAQAAELGVGTIYLYFKSRDDLYLCLMVERLERLREQYLKILARDLPPEREVRAIARAYLDYLADSPGLFMAQLAVTPGEVFKMLEHPSEIDNYRRMMALGREIFQIWEAVVARAAGQIGRPVSSQVTELATAIWARLNGAFLLTGDPETFKEVTGADARQFLEKVLNFEFEIPAVKGMQDGGACRVPWASTPRLTRRIEKNPITREATLSNDEGGTER